MAPGFSALVKMPSFAQRRVASTANSINALHHAEKALTRIVDQHWHTVSPIHAPMGPALGKGPVAQTEQKSHN
jgi:hypothetical protein